MAIYRRETSYPANCGVAITPSDDTVIAECRSLYIGGAGDLVVTFDNGEVVTFVGVAKGAWMPISPVHVMAATTATNIVAVW